MAVTEYVATALDSLSDGTQPPAITGAANLPDPDWNFDEPNLRNGIVRGTQTYYDGIPPDLSPDRPWLARFQRSIDGDPAPGADVGTVQWTQDPLRNENSFEYLRWTTERPDIEPGKTIWKSTRRIVGQPAVGSPVAAQWSAPVRVSVTRPRQWTLLFEGNVRPASNAWALIDFDVDDVDISVFSTLHFVKSSDSSDSWSSGEIPAAEIVAAGTTGKHGIFNVSSGSNGEARFRTHPDGLQVTMGARDKFNIRQVWGLIQ